MRPGDSIMYVKGVGEKKALKYKKLNIETVEELLYHFPARYEDRTVVKRFDEIANDEKVCSYGTIVNFEKSTPKRNSGTSRPSRRTRSTKPPTRTCRTSSTSSITLMSRSRRR